MILISLYTNEQSKDSKLSNRIPKLVEANMTPLPIKVERCIPLI